MARREKKTVRNVYKTVIFSVMAAVCFSTALSITALTKTVKITDGENTTVINTMNLNRDAILSQAGIKLGKNDKVVVTENSGSGYEVSIMRAFNVDLEDDGDVKSVKFNEGTVADALKAAGVEVGKTDSVTPAAGTVLKPDMKINVERWYNISVNDGGKTTACDVPEGTVKEALDFLGVKLTANDKVSVNPGKKVKDNLKVRIDRVTYKTTHTTQYVDYKTVEKKTDKLYTGETRVQKEGVKGEKLITSKLTYVNGKLKNTDVIAKKTTKKAVNEVVLVGTAERPETPAVSSSNYFAKNVEDSATFSSDETKKTFVDMNGNTVKYLRSYTGSGTAYYAPAGSLTASGRLAQVGNVAVNPNIIPLGSKLYIVSNDGQVCYGYATAADTGGALFEGTAIVDLFYDTFDECTQFGRRDVTVYVIEEGDNAYVR